MLFPLSEHFTCKMHSEKDAKRQTDGKRCYVSKKQNRTETERNLPAKRTHQIKMIFFAYFQNGQDP